MEDLLTQIISGKASPYYQIDRWIQNAEFHKVKQLVHALAQVWDDRSSEWLRFYGVYIQITDGLALSPGEKYIETLLAVLEYRPQDDLLVRRVAAQLVAAQNPEALDNLVSSSTHLDLWMYLIHELVIAGFTISSYKNLSQVAVAIQEQNHPLRVLPLSLMSSEVELCIYRRPIMTQRGIKYFPVSYDVIGYNTAYSLAGLPDTPSEIKFIETTTPDLQARLQSAFESWTNESNGNFEARRFMMQNTLEANQIVNTRLLLDLNLDCLKGVDSSAVKVWEISGTQVINQLFYFALNGGAYDHGLGNVYGRLHMWKSVAALLNAPVSIPILSLNESLDNVHCFQMYAASSWFYNVAWDAAIIALSKDGQVLTFIAATDTD
jgi:Family of unknown function (DUF6183)